MNQGVINLSLSQMALSYAFIIIAILLTSLNGINRNKELVISLVRMTIQLSIAAAMVIASISSLIFFIVFVIKPEPLYNPQYLIPIGGMIMGNTMNGIALALKSILSSIDNQREKIEGSLMLGATPKMAMDEINKDAFDLAIMPTLNSMKNMGLITLPGMMTGQILGGVVPTIAIKYQIAVMTIITSSVAIGVFIFLKFSTNKFFNEEKQLINLNK